MANRVPDGLANRLRQVRIARYGPDSGDRLSRLLGVPAATWGNCEAGVLLPGELLLRFLVLTGAEPRWLLSGEGPMFRDNAVDLVSVLEFPQPVD